MVLGLFENFKKIFSACDSHTVQNSIWLQVYEYCERHHLNRTVKNERYHVFYEVIEDKTKQLRNKNKRSTPSKTKGRSIKTSETIQDDDKEVIPDYIKGANARLRDGTHDENFAFAIYFWFHAFAEDLSYAIRIDQKILADYPEITEKLNTIKSEIFVARPEKPIRSGCVLTEEQREKLTDQIERLGYDGLISIWLRGVSLSDQNGGMIEGELYCKDEGVYLECEGLDYDVSISLIKAVVDFNPEGVVLERRNTLDAENGKLEVDYYRSKRFPDGWTMIIEAKKDTSALKGELLARSTNGVLFYTKPDGNAGKSPRITAKHMLEGNHIKITHTGDEACDANKKRMVIKILKEEIIKVCGNQTVQCSDKPNEQFVIENIYD